jgi:hypothetical protein
MLPPGSAWGTLDALPAAASSSRGPSRLIYRPSTDARPDGRKSFAWTDYRDLVQTALQQLGGPIPLA